MDTCGAHNKYIGYQPASYPRIAVSFPFSSSFVALPQQTGVLVKKVAVARKVSDIRSPVRAIRYRMIAFGSAGGF